MNTKETVKQIFEDSLRTKQQFFDDDINVTVISEAAAVIVDCYRRGGKVLVFGNGGSAADSQHMAAELVVRFENERKSLPCIALSVNTSILTAISNDYDYTQTFSRQIESIADPKDIVIAISTSGNSPNVIEGVKTAREKKIPVVALTGRGGGKLSGISDFAIVVKSENTARIQEVHVTIIHILCKIVEDALLAL